MLEETNTLKLTLYNLATELRIATLEKLGYASKGGFHEQKLYVRRTPLERWRDTLLQTPSRS